ncbi:MAG: tRNA (adenosine(37)-N6)-threonylcarbamoyltransferase complex ATPase subunit type 1 TsaE [Flavobacteriales bacterium]
MLATLTLRKPSEAPDIAQLILQGYPEARVFAFHGDLGAGKTTLIKAMGQVLGVADAMSSPTFALVNEYRSGAGDPVYHFDLYRLKDAAELDAIGFSEYVDSGNYCFIEWPQLAEELLPPGTLHVTLEEGANGVRLISLGISGE